MGEGLTEIMFCLSDSEVFAWKMPMCDDGCVWVKSNRGKKIDGVKESE